MISFRKLAWLFIAGIILSIVTFSVATFSYAQEAGPIQILGVNTNNHPQIEITVAVFDKSGRPLNGLKADNFSVFEDNTGLVVKSVDSVTDESIPLGIVLVMDTSESMDDAPLSKAKAAALAFVDQVRPIDELALISFNSKITVLQTMTKDRAAIKTQINSLTSQGQTALYDTIVQAVQTAQTSTAKRRVIVLLTDGNEYGNLSKTSGVDAYTAASKAGIPVFTIGLGFEVDEKYLKAVSDNTGGAFYQAPRPEDLSKVYGNIATLLRSLYVITVNTALPANGDTHSFRVEFHSDNNSGSTQSNARYPAPIPVVRFSGLDPNVPLDKTITVTPQIVADNKLTSYEYQLDGKPATSGSDAPKPLDINPIKLTPGAHSLTLAVHDDKDHVGQGTLDFKVAALPPIFTIQGLKAGETINDNRAVMLNVTDSQTPTGTATFDIDGTALRSIDQAPYALTLDVLSLAPGKHTLTAQLKNADATGTQSVEFNVSPSPRQTATASAVYQAQTATASAVHVAQTATASAVRLAQTATADALRQAQTATANAVRQGQTATANAIQQATRNAQDTLTAMPTNTPTTTNTPTATATSVPTTTPRPTLTSTNTPIPPTLTSSATYTPLPVTATSNRTATALVALAATLTAPQTAVPTATETPVPTHTETPRPTNTSAPTATETLIPPTATNTPRPTNTNVPTSTETPVPPTATNTNTPLPTATFTATVTATATATATFTMTLSPTPSSTLSATPSLTPTLTAPLGGLGSLTTNPAVLLCGGLLVILVIVVMILSGARRSPRRLS